MGWTELKYRFPGDAPSLQQLGVSLRRSTRLPDSVLVVSPEPNVFPDGTQRETLRLYDPAHHGRAREPGEELFTISMDPQATVIVEFSPFQGGLPHDYLFRALKAELSRRNALQCDPDSADQCALRPLPPSWLDRPWAELSTTRKLISRATYILGVALTLIASPFFILWGEVLNATSPRSKSFGAPRRSARPVAPKVTKSRYGGASVQPATALSFEEYLSRLFDFVRPMPGCPTWSRVLVAEDLGDDDNLDLLLSPAEYTGRFSELLASRPWVNLHVVGLWREALVVSVEVARDAAPSPTPASVQLSGPEGRIAVLPNWNLALLRGT